MGIHFNKCSKSKALIASLAIGAFLFHQDAFSQTTKIEKITHPGTADQMADQLEKQNDNSPANNVSTGTTHQQTELNIHSVGVGIGQTFLNSDFDKLADSSITGDLYYNYSASYSFDFMANLHYWKQSKNKTEVRTLGIAPGIKGKFYQFDNFTPYAVGGLGFYNPLVKRYQNDSLVESDSKWVFGYHFGAGADLKLNETITVGVLVHFHNPFDVKQDNGSTIEGSYQKLMLTSFYSF